MAYQIASILMISSDLEAFWFWHEIFCIRLCSRWQDFNWRSASRGPTATASFLLLLLA